ncbi:unnamed protein product [Durusdinium trenchii]|uniref:Uncharacterized protein n=1 Tax=Durusdinium trenchii TaxID=1381693 RepID=A0ABP0RWP0_9DINO
MRSLRCLGVQALALAAAEQEWIVTAGIPVSLQLLTNLTTRIKLLASNSTCETGGPWIRSVLVGCNLQCVEAFDNTTVALHPLSHDSGYPTCNVSVIAVHTLNASLVEVEFDGSPDLLSGDRILLGSEVLCGANCQQAELTALRGVATGGNAIEPTSDSRRFKMYIDPPFGQGQLPAFLAFAVSWVSKSRARTAEELYSALPQDGVQVCLEINGGSFIQAGRLTFTAPPEMPVACLSPTSTVIGAASPVVVTFRLPALPDVRVEATRLTLHFNLSQLEPLQADGAQLEARWRSGDESQALCGRLFRELWANGSGFPTPRGCSCFNSSATMRMQMHFDAGSAPDEQNIYHIVLTVVAGTSLDQAALQLWFAGFNPYFLYASGNPDLSRPFQAGAGPGDPHLSDVQVLGGSNGLLPLESGDLQLQIAGENDRPISGGAQFRMFLSPITAWATSGSCESTMHLNSSQRRALCKVLAVVPSMGFYSMLEFELPVDLGQISWESRLELGIGVELPAGSFFAERLALEVSQPDFSKPHYVESSNFLSWLPDSSATAQIVTEQNTGNLAPFSKAQNQLYIHLALAATLRSALEAPGGATFSVMAPAGYSLLGAESSSRMLDDFRWSCTGRQCTYTLPPFAALWAGSAAIFRLNVINPAWALQRCDSQNVWRLSMWASGYHSASMETEYDFKGFDCVGQGVTLLGRLSTHIYPTRLTISPAVGDRVINTLQVFFTTEQAVEAPAKLKLEAHQDFELLAGSCSDLPAAYYAADGLGTSTWRLPNITSCQAHDRYALASTDHALRAGQPYGFQIQVLNPQHYNSSQRQFWALTSFTDIGEEVDKASSGLATGLYQEQMRVVNIDEDDGLGSALGLQVIDGFPFAAFGQEAQVVMLLRSSAELFAALRITAPTGYQWMLAQGTAAAEQLPGGAPTKSASVLLWPHARYIASKTYEFTSDIRLPEAAPLMSTAFFVEFGYDQASVAAGARFLAGRVDAPPIRALKNTKVEPWSKLRGEQTRLVLQVEVVTPIPSAGALVLRSPSGFNFIAPCFLEEVKGSLDMENHLMFTPLPKTTSCSTRPFPEKLSKAERGAQQADLVIQAGLDGIGPGVYLFEVAAINGETTLPTKVEGSLRSWCAQSLQCWTFLSIANARGESFGELDARSFVPGYGLKSRMPEAVLVPAPGRSDRPLTRNRLTFGFSLDKEFRGNTDKGLFLRGPVGFHIKEDCLVSAANLELEPNGFWAGAPVHSCQASGNTAALTTASALKVQFRYAFAVEVQQNPPATPMQNFWCLETSTESSLPFSGFDIQAFTAMVVMPLTRAAGGLWPHGAGSNLVNVSFRPQTTQSSAGAIVITAPLNFILQHNTGCGAFYQVGQAGTSGSDVCAAACQCHLQATNVLAITFNDAVLIKGQEYIMMLRVVGSLPQSDSTWSLQSFDDTTSQKPLDFGEVAGFELSSALSYLSVGVLHPEAQNSAVLATPNQDGSALLELYLVLQLPHQVLGGDVLDVELPPSYTLLSKDCEQFRWWEGLPEQSQLQFVAVTCLPSGVRSNFTGSSEVLLQAHQAITLKFNVQNPPRSFDDVFWHVRHYRSFLLKAAGAFRSWKVFPLLAEVSIEIASTAGTGLRANAINVAFVAVESAERLVLKASPGFDFRTASSKSGTILFGTENPNVVALDLIMKEGERTEVRLLHIQLPDAGPAHFALETIGNGKLVARRLDIPVHVPGHLLLSDPVLLTEYQANPHQYPLQSKWPAHFNGHISLELEVTFPALVAPGQSLRLSGKPFQIQGGFEMLSLGGAPMATIARNTPDGELIAAVSGEGLLPATPYKMSAIGIAPNTALESVAYWSLEVIGTDENLLGIGGVEAGIDLVSRCKVEVAAQRSPPLALIEIELRINFEGSMPDRWVLVAPNGFTFPPDCATLRSENVSCFADMDNQASATVQGLHGSNVTLNVETPTKTPTPRSWLLAALNQKGSIVAWCEDKLGLSVAQIRSVAVVYPAVAGASAELAVRFLLSDPLPGGAIELVAPPEIELNCTGELQQMSLHVQGCTTEMTSVKLLLASELSAGIHAFARVLKCFMPATTPLQNSFSLFVRRTDGGMHEAASAVPGRVLQEKILVDSRPLQWTAAEAGQASSIVIGFQLHQRVGKNTLGAVLITLAESFKHALRFAEDLEILNSALPIARSRDGWAEVRKVDRIWVFLDAAQPVPAGAYDSQLQERLRHSQLNGASQRSFQNLWRKSFRSISFQCLAHHDVPAQSFRALLILGVTASLDDVSYDRLQLDEIKPIIFQCWVIFSSCHGLFEPGNCRKHPAAEPKKPSSRVRITSHLLVS